MRPPYPALTIAKWFIAWAQDEDADRSNLKLQKLLYYAQGWHLARTGDPLFRDTMQAWSHGPVVPSVYQEFKHFGSADVDLADDSFRWDDIDEKTTDLLIQVWNTYGGLAAWRLRNMTHDEAPWKEHFQDGRRGTQIPQEDMKNYFSRLAQTS